MKWIRRSKRSELRWAGALDPLDPHPVPPKHPRLRLLLRLALYCTGAGAITGLIIVLLLVPTLPPVGNLANDQLKVPMRIYSADNHLLGEFGEERRIPISIDQAPPQLIHAVLSAEDDQFYHHWGVDFPGIARAAIHDIMTGRRGQGASTITMQVARNFFLSPKRTYTRKLKEILLAFKLEYVLTKNQILELYLNKIFLGHRAYGFAAAAQVYYGKPLNELTLAQMAMLAGLPKAPSRNNPITNPDHAVDRRAYVLHRMAILGYITKDQLDKALKAPVTASNHEFEYEVKAPYVAEMVRQYMFHTYAKKAYAGGFNVHTTIQAKNQKAANEALHAGVIAYDHRHGYRGAAGHVPLPPGPDKDAYDDLLKGYNEVGGLVPALTLLVGDKNAVAYTQDGYIADISWPGMAWARRFIDRNHVGPQPKSAHQILHVGDVIYLDSDATGAWQLAQIPEVSAAIVSLRPSDGAILALSGGFDFNQSKFNRVTQAERQPGSNIKPFLYSAALNKGYTAASRISGAPIVVNDANLETEWKPENYSGKFFGPTRLRTALVESLNLVSVRLLRAITPDYAVKYLARFGFDSNELADNLSLALGNASLTPLQVVSAYAVFANGGYRIEPYFITRVEDAQGHILEQTNPLVVCKTCAQTPKPYLADNLVIKKPGDPTPGTPVPAAASAAPNPAVAPTGASGSDNNLPTATSTSPLPSVVTFPPVRDGEPLPSIEIKPRYAPEVISPENDFIMTSIMRDVIRHGTGRRAMSLKRNDLAGKTGTTNDFRDAWFSGYNGDVVTTAWMGFDQPATLGRSEEGSHAALPMWITYMGAVLKGVPETELVKPDDIVEEMIDPNTGRYVGPVPAGQTDPNVPVDLTQTAAAGTTPAGTTPAGTTPAGTTPAGTTATGTAGDNTTAADTTSEVLDANGNTPIREFFIAGTEPGPPPTATDNSTAPGAVPPKPSSDSLQGLF
jgi:penicillin-binding protein 1A